MGILIFDTNKVNAYVLPTMSKAKTEINNSLDACNKIKQNIPSSFLYRSTLNDIYVELNNIKNTLNDLKNNIEKRVSTVSKYETKNESNINLLTKQMSDINISVTNANSKYSFDKSNKKIKTNDSTENILIKNIEAQILELKKYVESKESISSRIKSYGLSEEILNYNISSDDVNSDGVVNAVDKLLYLKMQQIDANSDGFTNSKDLLIIIQAQDLNSKLKSIEQLESIKETLTKTLEEQYYLDLQNNLDFEKLSTSDLTDAEAEAITQLYMTYYNTGFSYILTSEQFYDYNVVKEKLGNLGASKYLDWNLIKSAYDKGFNIYEVVMCNLELVEASETMNICPTASIEGEIHFGQYAHMANYMTDAEKKTVLYLCNTEGIDAAQKYLNNKMSEINSREGAYNAMLFLEELNSSNDVEKFLKTGLKGIGDGVETFFEGLESFGNMDETISAQQYETMFIIAGLSEEQINRMTFLSEKERTMLKGFKGLSSNKFLQGTYEVSSSIGNMVVPMAVSAVSSLAITPVGGKILGSSLMGISIAGNASESAYQNGNSYWNSMFYGTLSGASEATLGYFLGGIPWLSKLDDIPGLKGYLLNILNEGGEEAIQAVLDPLLRKIALGENYQLDLEELAKSGIYGMITAGLLKGGTIVVNGINITVNNIKYQTIETISNIEKYGYEVDYTKINDIKYIYELENLETCINTAKILEIKVNYDKNTKKYYYTDLKGQKIEAVDLIGDNAPSTKKIQNSMDILKNRYGQYVNQQKFSNVENNVVVHKTIEDFKNERKKYPGNADRCKGFNAKGVVHLRPDASIGNIMHEMLHSLGTINPKRNAKYVSINEAFTDYLVYKAVGVSNNSGYLANANIISELDSILTQIGYSGIIEESFFNSNPDKIKVVVDGLSYDGFYEKLAFYFSTIDNDKATKKIRQEAEIKAQDLIYDFGEKVGLYQ